jgi:putative membrane protein (TIGR04086 family)
MRRQVVNTKARLSRVQWDLVLKTAALVYVLTLLLGLALSAPLLMFFNRGQLDAQDAVQATSLLIALLVIVVAAGGAFWVARTVEHSAWLHGFLVGLLVGVISCLLDVLFSRQLHLMGLLLYALMVLAGWLGGVLGARWRRQRPLTAPGP